VTLTADHVAAATGCPQRNVAAHWPNILAALEAFGIASLPVQIAAAATVAVETRSFQPIRERRANPAKQPALWATQERYWPSGYYGRGFVQLTWRGNYLDAGENLGLDLVGVPDLALEPTVAARVLALYLKQKGIPAAAEAGDWRRVRRLVNGGTNALAEFLAAVQALQEAPHA
jgi:hypothetical protein